MYVRYIYKRLTTMWIFFTIHFWWGFHKLRYLFTRTRLSRQLPICLVYMPMRIWIHLFSDCVCLFFFYFVASVVWLHCFWNIFLLLWCICFRIAIAYRFHIRCLNIHMAFVHGDGIGFTIFSITMYNCSGQKFLDSQTWVYSFHICGYVYFL